MGAFVSGAALLLATLLVVAGTAKAVRPRAFAHALRRLLPPSIRSRSSAARALASAVTALELVEAVALLAAPALPLRAAVAVMGVGAALTVGFVAVVVHAARTGAGCGCFSSLSDGPAAGAELGRAVALSVVAVPAAVASPWHPPQAYGWTTVAAALGLGALVAAGTAIGVRLRPGAGPVGARGMAAATAGIVSSRFERASLPDDPRPLGPRDALLMAAVRRSPSFVALDAWLAERGHRAEWDRATVQRVVADTAGRPPIPCAVVAAPLGQGVTATATIAWDGEVAGDDAVLFGSVDGVPIGAAGGTVMERLAALHDRAEV